MSKIKLTDTEIAMLDAIIALKKEEEGGSSFIEIDESEAKFFRTALEKTAELVVDKITQVIHRITQVAEDVIGGTQPANDNISEPLNKILEGKSLEKMTLDELIEIRKVISKNQKFKQ